MGPGLRLLALRVCVEYCQLNYCCMARMHHATTATAVYELDDGRVASVRTALGTADQPLGPWDAEYPV